MTRTDLKSLKRKQLADIARDRNIAGWYAMRKDELVDALAKAFRKNRRHAASGGRNGHDHPAPGSNGTPTNGGCRLLPTTDDGNGHSPADRLLAESVGPEWLHVRWVLSPQILKRAEAALGTEWHRARPVIRVFDWRETGDAASSKRWSRDAEITQPLDTWFVPVPHPGRTYGLQLGYRTPSGRFFMLVRSAKVKTPRKGTFRAANPHAGMPRDCTPYHRNGTSGKERAGAVRSADASGGSRSSHTLSRRADHSESGTSPSSSAVDDVCFTLDAEVVLHGEAPPYGELTLMNEPIQQGADGRFSVRFALEEGRQIIPAAFVTSDGCEKHTIVLALERNTKHLEPQSLDELA